MIATVTAPPKILTQPAVREDNPDTDDPGLVVRGAGTFDVIPIPVPVPQLSSVSVSVSALGDNTLVAGVLGQKIRIYRLFLVFSSSAAVFFRDGVAGPALTGDMLMYAGGSITFDFESEPWFQLATDSAFVLNLSAAVQVSGRVYYVQA